MQGVKGYCCVIEFFLPGCWNAVNHHSLNIFILSMVFLPIIHNLLLFIALLKYDFILVKFLR